MMVFTCKSIMPPNAFLNFNIWLHFIFALLYIFLFLSYYFPVLTVLLRRHLHLLFTDTSHDHWSHEPLTTLSSGHHTNHWRSLPSTSPHVTFPLRLPSTARLSHRLPHSPPSPPSLVVENSAPPSSQVDPLDYHFISSAPPILIHWPSDVSFSPPFHFSSSSFSPSSLTPSPPPHQIQSSSTSSFSLPLFLFLLVFFLPITSSLHLLSVLFLIASPSPPSSSFSLDWDYPLAYCDRCVPRKKGGFTSKTGGRQAEWARRWGGWEGGEMGG